MFTERRAAMRLFCVACIFAGLFGLYVGQARVMVVMAGVAALTFLLVLFYKRCIGQAAIQIGLGVVLAVVSFQFALDLAGIAVTKRMSSLVEQSPVDVYYTNRGIFLEYTLNHQVAEYPLGAGAGRWGMMSYYFADPAALIWAEIQWTGWLLDGGIPIATVSARLGHSQLSTTLDIYAHAIPATDQQAAAYLAGVLRAED